MLEVKNLTRYYGEKCAVNHISFHLDKGEILGLLGLNGAGKSTTMNMITGYLAAEEGEVWIDGINLMENPVMAKMKIGYLPERPPLYPDMTVREYLDFMYRIKKIRIPRKEHIAHICEAVQICDVQNKLIRCLSKGYGQRVGIAQAMLGNPALLILDEPTVGLDPGQIREIRELIRQMGKNQTVILSSHILSEVQAVCDRIIVINKGNIVADDTTDSLTKEENGERRFTIFLKGGKPEYLPRLDRLPNVLKVADSIDSQEDGIRYQVTVGKEYTSHEELLKIILQSGWDLDRLYWNRPDLEEIFMSLTAGENI